MKILHNNRGNHKGNARFLNLFKKKKQKEESGSSLNAEFNSNNELYEAAKKINKAATKNKLKNLKVKVTGGRYDLKIKQLHDRKNDVIKFSGNTIVKARGKIDHLRNVAQNTLDAAKAISAKPLVTSEEEPKSKTPKPEKQLKPAAETPESLTTSIEIAKIISKMTFDTLKTDSLAIETKLSKLNSGKIKEKLTEKFREKQNELVTEKISGLTTPDKETFKKIKEYALITNSPAIHKEKLTKKIVEIINKDIESITIYTISKEKLDGIKKQIDTYIEDEKTQKDMREKLDKKINAILVLLKKRLYENGSKMGGMENYKTVEPSLIGLVKKDFDRIKEINPTFLSEKTGSERTEEEEILMQLDWATLKNNLIAGIIGKVKNKKIDKEHKPFFDVKDGQIMYYEKEEGWLWDSSEEKNLMALPASLGDFTKKHTTNFETKDIIKANEAEILASLGNSPDNTEKGNATSNVDNNALTDNALYKNALRLGLDYNKMYTHFAGDTGKMEVFAKMMTDQSSSKATKAKVILKAFPVPEDLQRMALSGSPVLALMRSPGARIALRGFVLAGSVSAWSQVVKGEKKLIGFHDNTKFELMSDDPNITSLLTKDGLPLPRVNTGNLIVDMGAYMVPFAGNLLDYRDMKDEWAKGNTGMAVLNSITGTIGMIGDVISFIPGVGTAIGQGLKGATKTLKFAPRIVKAIKATKFGKSMKWIGNGFGKSMDYLGKMRSKARILNKLDKVIDNLTLANKTPKGLLGKLWKYTGGIALNGVSSLLTGRFLKAGKIIGSRTEDQAQKKNNNNMENSSLAPKNSENTIQLSKKVLIDGEIKNPEVRNIKNLKIETLKRRKVNLENSLKQMPNAAPSHKKKLENRIEKIKKEIKTLEGGVKIAENLKNKINPLESFYKKLDDAKLKEMQTELKNIKTGPLVKNITNKDLKTFLQIQGVTKVERSKNGNFVFIQKAGRKMSVNPKNFEKNFKKGKEYIGKNIKKLEEESIKLLGTNKSEVMNTKNTFTSNDMPTKNPQNKTNALTTFYNKLDNKKLKEIQTELEKISTSTEAKNIPNKDLKTFLELQGVSKVEKSKNGHFEFIKEKGFKISVSPKDLDINFKKGKKYIEDNIKKLEKDSKLAIEGTVKIIRDKTQKEIKDLNKKTQRLEKLKDVLQVRKDKQIKSLSDTWKAKNENFSKWKTQNNKNIGTPQYEKTQQAMKKELDDLGAKTRSEIKNIESRYENNIKNIDEQIDVNNTTKTAKQETYAKWKKSYDKMQQDAIENSTPKKN